MVKKKNILFYGLLITAVFFFFISLSQTATRYNLNQQLAISDKILNKKNNIYPPKEFTYHKETTVSQYPPGIAIIITPINFFIPNDVIKNIIYALIAVISHFSLLIILAIIHSRISGSKLSISFFLCLIFSLLISKSYSFYSLELKPDTLAFSLGLWAIFLAKLDKKDLVNPIRNIVLGIFFGMFLIFKQQYITFLFGIVLYNIFFFCKKKTNFIAGAILSSTTVLIIFGNIENFWFWNITTFQDDGFMTFAKYLNKNIFLYFNFFLFYLVVINIQFQRITITKVYSFLKNYLKLMNNHYTWILIVAASGCFLSGLKNGGNTSNTGIALMLLSPLVFSIIKNFKAKWLKIFLFFGIISILPFTIKSVNNLKLFYSLKSKFTEQNIDHNKVVGYGSTFYSIVKNNKKIILHDYWTNAQRNGIRLSESLEEMLKEKYFDFILIESYLLDSLEKQASGSYEILAQNELGALIKKISF